jgi:hypothetical protein
LQYPGWYLSMLMCMTLVYDQPECSYAATPLQIA